MADETGPLDLQALRAWIGRRDETRDVITPRLEASLRAVFDKPPGTPSFGEPATPTIHWCLAPAIAPMAEIGDDGHPRRGGFLPPVPLPRRMWAGGELTLLDPLRVGDEVTKQSTIMDVTVKEGRTGTLCFVTLRHRFITARGPALEERQDLVFRGDGASAAPSAPVEPPGEWRRGVAVDPVLLFRYSALTFNGHRIHYDRPYATQVEGYPDLVVHGPLQAAVLFGFATEIRGAAPQSFAFRGVSPLFVGTEVTLNARAEGAGLRLWTSDPSGRVAMQATAVWP